MSEAASADLFRLLAVFAEPPTPAHADYAATLGLSAPGDLAGWRVAHTGAFVEQCPPYASTIVGEGGQIGGEAADRVGDFRRMLGYESVDTPDYLPALLADYAELVARSADDARAAHARAAMLWEHLLCWAPLYLDGVSRSAPAPYDGWAAITRDVLYLEAEAVSPPNELPLHLRAAPPAADIEATERMKDAVRLLLTPAASGILLTRADLARAVTTLEAGLVQNSRAFIVEHLFEQDAPGLLAWLAAEAETQQAARAAEQPRLGVVATFWHDRVKATLASLQRLSEQAGRTEDRDTAAILRSA